MKTIYVDSCFLIALYDETDTNHSKARHNFVRYFDNTSNKLVVPWPILFETFINLKIDLFMTFNIKDFGDVCKKFHRSVL